MCNTIFEIRVDNISLCSCAKGLVQRSRKLATVEEGGDFA